jgi:hypothetical protein
MPAARLLGTDGVGVNTDNATGLNQTTGVTLAMWERVEGEALSGSRMLFAHADSATVTDNLTALRSGYGIRISAGSLIFSVASAAAVSTLSFPLPRFLSPGAWQHYAVAFDNATGIGVGYCNGRSLGTATTATVGATTGTTKTYLGLTAVVMNVFDAQVYVDQVLSPDQIRQTMRPNYRALNATARWFGLGFRDPGASGAILDETGNSNNLTSSSIDARLTSTKEPDWRAAARNAEIVSSFGALVSPTLVFAQEPSNAWDAEVIRPAITVNLTTDGSTIDTGATDTVTVAIASGTGSLGGTAAVAAVAGVATFSTLTVTGSGAHTLTATATGYTADTSASFKVATGTGVPGGGVIILGGQMQRAMKDAETTAARKRVFFDIRDSAGAGWAGSVTGVKAQRSLSGATIAATTNDIVRVGGAMHYVELTDAEAAAGAAGDVIGCYVAADTGRLESTHGFYEITADDVTAAALTSTQIANAVVEAEIDALETYNRTSNTAATITGPTNGATTLTIATDAAYEPIKSIS